MRSRRVAAATALLISAGSITAFPAAFAADGTTLYVDKASSACTDTGATAGSAATPYCTLQSAVNVVTAGETVLVRGGSYAPITISTSGTAAAPITITSPSGTPSTAAFVGTTGLSPAVTVSGANYVNVKGLTVGGITTAVVVITGSSHVTFDSNAIRTTGTAKVPTVSVTGGSSSVTVSRNRIINPRPGPAVEIDGGSGDLITTNGLAAEAAGPGIVVDGVSDTAVTGNTLKMPCGLGIGIIGGSTGTSVQNNIVAGLGDSTHSLSTVPCPTAPTAAFGIEVDSASAAGTTVDYNDVTVPSNDANYSWSGTAYGTASALNSATGQASHDLNTATVADSAAMSGTAPSEIDSANANAPGELATDIEGNARVDDPVVADTGTGAHTYYDRGAVEAQAVQPYQILTTNTASAPAGGTIAFTGSVLDAWHSTLTCTIDFGDGTSTTTAASAGTCATSHAYADLGTYTPKLTVTNAEGGSTSADMSPLTIVTPVSLSASLSLTPGYTTAATVSASAVSSWDIATLTVNYGDGTSVVRYGSNTLGDVHAYSKPGTYTVALTATDVGGATASTSAKFTTAGAYYTALTPTRILDTRSRIGVPIPAKVPANGTVKLKIAGNGSIPSTGVTAVALNVTATNTAKPGFITAYPDGGSVPNASNLNFAAGQTVPNLVIVKVGADGYVDLRNSSAGGTDLIADVAGYYSVGSTDGYTPVAPVRLLDTRTTKAKIPANGTTRVYVGSYGAVSAVALNVTVTNPAKSGNITAYPSGSAVPNASNLNFTAGLTVPNEVIVKAGPDGYVDFANQSSGSTDLIVDLTGYFSPTAASGLVFVPLTPTRFLDTRNGTGLARAGKLGAGGIDDLRIDVAQSIGTQVSAIAGNITVTGPASGGHITVYPDDETTVPGTSALNFAPGETIANAATVGVGDTTYGGIKLYNGSAGATDLVVDVSGYYDPAGL